METLFTQKLAVDGVETTYNVGFHDDAYYFEPQGAAAPSFSLKREHDEWIANNKLNESWFSAATAALDKYLLSQH